MAPNNDLPLEDILIGSNPDGRAPTPWLLWSLTVRLVVLGILFAQAGLLGVLAFAAFSGVARIDGRRRERRIAGRPSAT